MRLKQKSTNEVYHSAYLLQRGAGLDHYQGGNQYGGSLRHVLGGFGCSLLRPIGSLVKRVFFPEIKRVVREIRVEAAKDTIACADDVMSGRKSVKRALKEVVQETGNIVNRKMRGGRRRRRAQKMKTLNPSPAKRRHQHQGDIFNST